MVCHIIDGGKPFINQHTELVNYSMLRHKSFWVILLLSAIGWLLFTMSENNTYSADIKLKWEGYDTARYAVAYSDSVLPVSITSNGFRAIAHYMAVKKTPYTIAVHGDTLLRVGSGLLNNMAGQLRLKGVVACSSPVESLRIDLSERCRRAFVPRMEGVAFQFANQYGLSGVPVLRPDTVWLYGDSVALSKIKEIHTAPATIADIRDSGHYTLSLDPVWKEYKDIRSSVDVVDIFVPVDKYSEKSVVVPVTLLGDAGNGNLRLYPGQVKVTLWVSTNRYNEVTAQDIEAVVEYHAAANPKDLPVRLTKFPSFCRIKQVEPAALQYVIIK